MTTPGPGPPGIRPHWSLGGQLFYCPGPWGRSVGLALQGPDRWCDLPPLGIEGRMVCVVKAAYSTSNGHAASGF